jgi:hypothetical protein
VPLSFIVPSKSRILSTVFRRFFYLQQFLDKIFTKYLPRNFLAEIQPQEQKIRGSNPAGALVRRKTKAMLL